MMNGQRVSNVHSCACEVQIGESIVSVDCLITNVVPGYGVLLGMDIIDKLGGVTVRKQGKEVCFGVEEELSNLEKDSSTRERERVVVASACDVETLAISDKDFEAEFKNGKWEVSWVWAEGDEAPLLRNRVEQYSMADDVKSAFHREVQEWVEKGYLQPFSGAHDGLIPLMAVVQPSKEKVRPVLDFRELNQHVSSHTGQSVVCSETIRCWRKQGTRLSVVDLKSAYLQIRVKPELWPYQVVVFKGQKYCLTRLGFGLNVAPKIMTAIVNKVLSLDDEVARGTDSYIDDVMINEEIVSVEKVVSLLNRFGLETKPAEKLEGARVLGLRLYRDRDGLTWKRDNVIDSPSEEMTKRQLFSWCGKLVGHFPVASWLRPACSFLKRTANDSAWDSPVPQDTISKAFEIWDRVISHDPVGGIWAAEDGATATVYCDASSIAIGVALESGGSTIEDASWLRKPNDASHINLAELEAVIRGLNLVIAWDFKKVKVITDSKTVFNWLHSVVTDENRVKTNALSDVLIKRRLGLIRDLVQECSLEMETELVPSALNKADRLTRVPKSWLVSSVCGMAEAREGTRLHRIREIHDIAHAGEDKTLFLLGDIAPQLRASRAEVKQVIAACEPCNSIDPSPARWEAGELGVNDNWTRLSCDVTHYRNELYLSVVDNGPSRYAIWTRLSSETSDCIVHALQVIWSEFGSPQELLVDNGAVFKSAQFVTFCGKWGVEVLYRAAYRPSGNGQVERNHRTVKRIAARVGCTVQEAVFLYNALPTIGSDVKTSPAFIMFNRGWSLRRWTGLPLHNQQGREEDSYKVGDVVYVKPGATTCTTRWPKGRVTHVTDRGAIEVDGVHRHRADLRHVRVLNTAVLDESEQEEQREQEGEGAQEESSDEEGRGREVPVVRCSDRVTARPWRYDSADYNRG